MRSGLSALMRSASVLGLIVGCSGAAISMWIDSDKNAQRSDLTSHHTPRLSKNRETSNTPRQRVAEVEWADRIRTEEFWRELRSPQSRFRNHSALSAHGRKTTRAPPSNRVALGRASMQ